MEAIAELSAEVDRAEIIAGVEQAAGFAASRSAGKNLRVRLDPESGKLVCYAPKRVALEVLDPDSDIHLEKAPAGASPGDVVEVPAPFGTAVRSAAWAAREVLETRLRAARLLTRAERYRDRIGRLETGIVARREGHDLIVNLGPVEGRLPASEQSSHEVFNPEDTIRAAVQSVEPVDPPVILSRIAPEVLAGVIERETPEVRQGVVSVRAVARHPGLRAKVAVWSDSPEVDAVAVCLGPGGARIRAVSRELRGERVDVVRWHESVEVFARNALRPAEVLSVSSAAEDSPGPPDRGRRGHRDRGRGDGRERRPNGLLVTVSEAELPRAVGKRGQNVRLAAELLGVPIEVVAEGQTPRRRRGTSPERTVSRGDRNAPRRGRTSDRRGERRGRSPERRREPRRAPGSRTRAPRPRPETGPEPRPDKRPEGER